MTRHTGFHEGELAVQRRAGVAQEAARLRGMLDPPHLGGGVSRFLADRDLAVLGARDEDGRLWVSPLTGTPGFLSTRRDAVRVETRPRAGDPLAGLPSGGAAALIVIDLASRRRLRLNGTLAAADDTGFELAVDQAYGNCPQYIQQRLLGPAPAGGPGGEDTPAAGARPADRLDAAQAAMVGRADTFFLGTAHPERGADVSHRGGPPGFVRVTDDGGLWWPDYPGNNMFNSLGNLASDPAAALLFVDFATGTTLQLSGTAAVDWTAPGAPGDDGSTGRRVRFTPRHAATGRVPVRADAVLPYRLNPPLTA
ncbi:pyridoxamine 5'-phosphate oxidase family protein [Actinacidiphila glaucinigra]|uniref:pyridoxamine 5'-phosphate oxidase family protein n=1 Tax=Actinacidiphila glaucinigra TaxID=235986 RepID=UPI002DD8F717|nr:pyridoxamine 5'-phosphate oxidase family protein [Actinacidiphila glaucinigra]WSD58516.1 pyridoxamine 5'-phosphate oxidase family protein [Actinacidiphila glaucinigra]